MAWVVATKSHVDHNGIQTASGFKSTHNFGCQWLVNELLDPNFTEIGPLQRCLSQGVNFGPADGIWGSLNGRQDSAWAAAWNSWLVLWCSYPSGKNGEKKSLIIQSDHIFKAGHILWPVKHWTKKLDENWKPCLDFLRLPLCVKSLGLLAVS